jgi:2-polyprenyl-6-hydroxyphenyl methylase/3-demethylubiquinone-9 3-methyltransferase
MGATVMSVDLDPMSVECCRRLRESAGSPPNWTVLEGSVLDEALVARLPLAEIVYSWGVLHHTGDMWRAVSLAASRVRPGGLFCIALYNKVESRAGGSAMWHRIKRAYVRQSRPVQKLMEWGHGAYRVAVMLATFRNPIKVARTYYHERGMSLWHDWVDWLGGYPYEYASAGEVFEYGRTVLGFELLRMNTTSSLGCSEYVFRRPGDVLATRP